MRFTKYFRAVPLACLFMIVPSVLSAQEAPAVTGASSGKQPWFSPWVSPEDLVDRGIDRYIDKDYKGSIAECTAALSIEPNNSRAFYRRGLAQLALRDYSAAAKDLNRAAELSPTDPEVNYARGVALYQLSRIDPSLADYNKAIDEHIDLAGTYYDRGLAKYVKGDYKGAEEDYQKAIELRHKFLPAYASLARASGAAKSETAKADYEKAIQFLPNDAEGFYSLGLLRQDRGDFDGAIHDFDQVLTLEPNNESAITQRAWVLYDKGDVSAAKQGFVDAPKVNPTDPNALYGEGTMALKQNDLATASGAFDEAVKKQPDFADAILSRGVTNYKQGKLDEAFSDYNQALQLKPNDEHIVYDKAVVWLARASTAAGQRNWHDVAHDATEARNLQDSGEAGNYAKKDLAVASLHDGMNLYEERKYDQALREFQRATDFDPNLAPAHYDAYTALLMLEKPDDAEKEYRRYLDMAAGTPSDARTVLAKHVNTEYYQRAAKGYRSYQSGDFEAAHNGYASALKADDQNPDAYRAAFGQALASLQAGHDAQAENEFDQLLKSRKSDYAPAYNMRGVARLRQGNLDGAIDDFKKAVERDSSYALAKNNLAGAELIRSDKSYQVADLSKHACQLCFKEDWASARTFYEQAHSIKATPLTTAGRGLALYNSGKRKEGAKYLNASFDDSPNAYNNRAAMLVDQKHYEQALSNYNLALYQNYEDPVILLNRAEVQRGQALYYFRNGNKTAARKKLVLAMKDYDAAIDGFPRLTGSRSKNECLDAESEKRLLALAYYRRGQAYVAQDNFPAARKDYDKALELRPDYGEALASSADLRLLGEKNPALADREFAQAKLYLKPEAAKTVVRHKPRPKS